MDEQDNEYQRLVKLIDEIEATAPKPQQSTLDLSGTVQQMQSIKSKSYREMLDIIEGIEGWRRIRETPMQLPQQPSVVPPKPVKQKPQKQKRVQPQPQPQQPQPVQESTYAPPLPSAMDVNKKRQNVAVDLNNIAKRLGSLTPSIKEFTKKRVNVNVKDLVLPNLSVADQISELERIIEGLRERVFDKEHLDIVVQEVYGLDQVVEEEKKKMQNSGQQTSDLEKSLRELRDQRISEAKSLIEQNGAG